MAATPGIFRFWTSFRTIPTQGRTRESSLVTSLYLENSLADSQRDLGYSFQVAVRDGESGCANQQANRSAIREFWHTGHDDTEPNQRSTSTRSRSGHSFDDGGYSQCRSGSDPVCDWKRHRAVGARAHTRVRCAVCCWVPAIPSCSRWSLSRPPSLACWARCWVQCWVTCLSAACQNCLATGLLISCQYRLPGSPCFAGAWDLR